MSVNLKKYIKDICHIQTGLFAKPKDTGDVVYLQSKHFNENGELHTVIYPDLASGTIAEKHYLMETDVLFAAKGTKNFATVYENQNGLTVASTSFFILRLKDKKILPHYLAWLLNSQAIQTLLKGQAIGTAIPSISKQVLGNLEISIPRIETQKAILQITQLRKKEKFLKQQIEDLREKQIQQQIINAIK